MCGGRGGICGGMGSWRRFDIESWEGAASVRGMRSLATAVVLWMTAGFSVAGTPGEAAGIIAEYNKAMSQWMAGLHTA